MVTYGQTFLGTLAGSLLLTRFAPDYAPFTTWIANFLVLFSIFLTFTMIGKAFIYPFVLSPLRDIPMPKGSHWLMGQFPAIMKNPSGVPLTKFCEEVPNNGLIRYHHILNEERLLLTSPKALGEVLVQKNYEFIKPRFFRHNLGRLLGIGILLAEGDEHKKQRKMLLPAFSYRHIKELTPTFWEKSREVTEAMTEAIQRKAKTDDEDPKIVNTMEWASRVTLDIIGVAGMGQDFNAVADPNSELNQCYRNVFQPSGAARFLQLLSFFVSPWFLYKLPIKRNTEVIEARQTIRRVCFDLINKKRAIMKQGGAVQTDILSVAMEAGGFSDEDLVNQLMTFLAAGHETTASAMSWACYHLCSHPEIQSRLREEIRTHLPSISDLSNVPTALEVDKVAYLNAVCNEVLRLYPPVPMTVRIADCDSSILGHFVPAGTTIIVAPWAINKSKELWGDDADKFNPDRWMGPGRANTGGANSNYSFLTFLHGARSCIGQKFAQAEFACLLAAWVGRFEMEFADKDYVLEIQGGITSKPKGGLKVRMNAVDGW